jgi:putative endonuclease
MRQGEERRQRRRGPESHPTHLCDGPLGGYGESVAARFLERHGLRVVARNVTVGRGELDLIVRDQGRLVAVEVKTASWSGIGADRPIPAEEFTPGKQRQVRTLGAELGIVRVDLITVVLSPMGAAVRWLRDAA